MSLFCNLEILIYLDVVNEWLVSLTIKGKRGELTIFGYLLYVRHHEKCTVCPISFFIMIILGCIIYIYRYIYIYAYIYIVVVQFLSLVWLCGPMNCSIAGLPVLQHLPEFAQTHVYWVSDIILPSHSLSSPSPPAFKLSQHQDLFRWVSSLHQVAKVLELQHQSFQWIVTIYFL